MVHRSQLIQRTSRAREATKPFMPQWEMDRRKRQSALVEDNMGQGACKFKMLGKVVLQQLPGHRWGPETADNADAQHTSTRCRRTCALSCLSCCNCTPRVAPSANTARKMRHCENVTCVRGAQLEDRSGRYVHKAAFQVSKKWDLVNQEVLQETARQ